MPSTNGPRYAVDSSDKFSKIVESEPIDGTGHRFGLSRCQLQLAEGFFREGLPLAGGLAVVY
jgi:hypothetical protein